LRNRPIPSFFMLTLLGEMPKAVRGKLLFILRWKLPRI
jgi:hypothetical protein